MYENAHEAANAIKSLAFQGYQTSYAKVGHEETGPIWGASQLTHHLFFVTLKESFSAKLRRMADRSSTNVYISK